MNKPSVGRIVHYVAYGSPIQPDGTQKFKPEHRAAIITAVSACENCDEAGETYEPKVSICVFNPTGLFFHADCPHDEEGKLGGTWHWPEYVA